MKPSPPKINSRTKLPSALSIAGSDSGGGAGIQADLKTFTALAVHGTTAITAITAQNPKGVTGIQPVSPDILAKQIHAVVDAFHPSAVKTGMLYSAELMAEVVRVFADSRTPLVLDPVMIATSGATLINDESIEFMVNRLLPVCALVTPNLPEAERILGTRLKEPEDLRAAARAIYDNFGCAALVKGGHLRTVDLAIDFFYDGDTELLLEAPLVKGISTHGTGCAYSAAITAFLALGLPLQRAVAEAKSFITTAIEKSYLAGRFPVLSLQQASGR